MPTYRHVVAAMWPDGNADVGRFESRLGTSGRGRLTTAAIVRKAASSPNMTTARKTTGRQRRVTARNTTQLTTPTMRMSWVAPRLLPIRLQWFSADVRCAANQCGIVWSPSQLPLPYLVTSSPKPTTTPRMSTQATATPAATAPSARVRWRLTSFFIVPSGCAGVRSVRASGSRPSVTGSVSGCPAACRVSSKAVVVRPSQVMPTAQAPITSDR